MPRTFLTSFFAVFRAELYILALAEDADVPQAEVSAPYTVLEINIAPSNILVV